MGQQTAASVVRKRGEGTALWMLGGLYDPRLTSDETGGAISVMEFTVPPGASPPPHSHEQDEMAYVIEGTALMHMGEEVTEIGAGDAVFLPRGTTEWFEPTTTVRMLTVYLPGGMDKFFSEVAEPAARREIPPPPSAPPDVERIAAIGARYGLQLQGPPPGH